MNIFAARYEIREELGGGGTGQVYRVWDNLLRCELALKLLTRGEDVLAVREASALRALQSDYILPVLNAGVHNDIPFVVTEIAPRGSVEGLLSVSPHGIDVEQVLRLFRQMLIGLEYCHRQLILHRDVTPNNIFLDENDRARLGDFGAAANIRSDGTAERFGNQHVVAPEGFATNKLDVRSEIFSVGATLWRALTGSWPFEAETETDLYAKMISPSGARLRDEAPHVPRSVAAVVERALNPDVDQRYQNVADLQEALGNCRLSDHAWRRCETHAGHEQCWLGDFPSGAVTLCVLTGQRSPYIETRRAGGSRITAGCFTVPRRRLGVELRKCFDNL